MAFGDTLKGLLTEYAQLQTRGPNWRKQLEEEEFVRQQREHEVGRMAEETEMAPLRRRQAELGIESGELGVTTGRENLRRARVKEDEESERKAKIRALIVAGKLPEGFELDPEAAKYVEETPDREARREAARVGLDVARRQYESMGTPEEAAALREAQRKLIGAQSSYYSQRGDAAGAGTAGLYRGQAVPDKVVEAAWAAAKERVDADNDNPGWFTGSKLAEGSPEYNRAIAKAQADILEEEGYDVRSIAKSGLRPPSPEKGFIRTPDGRCFMVQGQVMAPIDCALAEEEDDLGAGADAETPVPQEGAPPQPGQVDIGEMVEEGGVEPTNPFAAGTGGAVDASGLAAALEARRRRAAILRGLTGGR